MKSFASENQGSIYLIEHDSEVTSVVRNAADQLGCDFKAIDDPSQLAQCGASLQPGCLLVSDVALEHAERVSGHLITDLQSYSSGGRLNLVGRGMATVVICQQMEGHGPDVQKIVRYMRAGAVTVLPTPLDPECLTHGIVEAIEFDRRRVEEEVRLERISQVYGHLAQRKRCVLQHMIDGRASKWSAHDLDVSRRTIELDRAEILNAFGVNNAIELARLMTETKCLPLDYSHKASLEFPAMTMAK